MKLKRDSCAYSKSDYYFCHKFRKMGIEIERKFLVNKELLPVSDELYVIEQAYLNDDPKRLVRIRISDKKAFLTIKSKGNGISRPEFEYDIPLDDAKELMKLALYPPISKIRHIIFHAGKKWELDVFSNSNEGLIMAELELDAEDEQFSIPDWVKEEVTGDKRFYNYELSKYPFSKW